MSEEDIAKIVEGLKAVVAPVVEQTWHEWVADHTSDVLKAIEERSERVEHLAKTMSNYVCPACREHGAIARELQTIESSLRRLLGAIHLTKPLKP